MSLKINSNFLRRPVALVSALAIVAVSVAPALTQGSAGAAGQVASRSLKMSDATPGASGVNNKYLITFTPATTAAQSLVIDFCSNTPIIGGACTAPAGFSAASATLTTGTGTANWALGALAANTVKVTKNTGSDLGTSAVDFTLNNITNPSAPSASFYARVYTYADAAYGAGSPYTNPTTLGNYVDYGGFALSTSNAVNISATVMETLMFCVSKLAPGPGCGTTGQAVTTPTLVIGHGSPLTLDASVVDTDTAYTQLSTNANSGVIVNLKVTSSTTCAGLSRDGGANCGIQEKGGTFGAIGVASGLFGLNVADGTGGTGTVSANAQYGPAAGYNMRPATYTTYGDPIMSSAGAVSGVNNLLTYAASATATTPAGVYSTTESMIATGTF